VKQVIRSDHPLLEEMRVDVRLKQAEVHVWKQETGESGGLSRLLEKAAGADLGIAVVDFAIAHTGTVVIASGPSQGRSISLLPTAFMGIVKASAIKTRMGEVLREIAAWNGNGLPAGIHFITGPSRSADIENDLTIGVHGPGIVCALVLDDE
jgi:L-lactate dehydrogenase complex protein LldG